MAHLTLQGVGRASTDYSANVETLPPVGWTALATIPDDTHTSRAAVEIQNRSASPVRVVIYQQGDPSTPRTVFTLEPASAQYRGGASYYSTTEKGQIIVYGAAGTETIAARVT